MISKLNSYMGFNESALKLRAYRQEVLSSNIANADTPHYKAQDFKFAQALQSATQGQSNFQMTHTHGRHLDSKGFSSFEPSLKFRNESQPSIDGNTVETDVEMAQFSDNAIRYQAEITFLNSKIANLRAALQGN